MNTHFSRFALTLTALTHASAAMAACIPSNQQVWTSAGRPTDMATADLNQDGVTDSITCNRDAGEITVRMSTPHGGEDVRDYEIPESFGSVPGPLGVATADFDGDGWVDFAVVVGTYAPDNTLRIYLNEGGGSFSESAGLHRGVDSPMNLAAIDVDLDGHIDVISWSVENDEAVFNLNDGLGNFGSPEPLTEGTLPNPRGMSAGDINDDGFQDYIFATSGVQSVLVRLSNPAGEYSEFYMPVGGFPFDVQIADFNGDGDLDAAIVIQDATTLNGSVRIFYGNGNGSFSPPSVHSIGDAPRAIELADMNGDGLVDLVAHSQYGAASYILAGLSAGGFASPCEYQLELGPGAEAQDMVVGDFNGDGQPDIGVPVRNLDKVVYIMLDASCLADLSGNQNVGFEDLLIVLSSWGACTGSCDADLDCDGAIGFGDVLRIISSWGSCQ